MSQSGCGGLKNIGPHRLLHLNVDGVALGCDIDGGSVSLEPGFEVAEAQARPTGSLFCPAVCRSRCRTLSYLPSTMSAWSIPCFCHDNSGRNLSYWLVLCVNFTQAGVITEKEAAVEKCLHEIQL